MTRRTCIHWSHLILLLVTACVSAAGQTVTLNIPAQAGYDNTVVTTSVDGSGNPNFLSAGSLATINVNGSTTPLTMYIGGVYQVLNTNVSATAVTPSASTPTINFVVAKEDLTNATMVASDFVTANTAPVYSYENSPPTCPSPTQALSATNVAFWFDLSTNQSKLCTSNGGSYVATPAIVIGAFDVTPTPSIDAVLAEPYRLNPYQRYSQFGSGSSTGNNSNNGENIIASGTVTIDGWKQYTSFSINGTAGSVAVTHTQWTGATPSPGLIIYSQNPILIINSASVTADSKGRSGNAGQAGTGGGGNGGGCAGAGGGGGGGSTGAGGMGGNRSFWPMWGISSLNSGGGSAGTSGGGTGGAGASESVQGLPNELEFFAMQCFGGSGGGGGGDGTHAGGSGGAAGGFIYLRAPAILVSSNSSVTANVGNGTTPAGGNAGGGGGGGGGSAVLAGFFVSNAGSTFNATHGTHGGGVGTGGAGGDGGDGLAVTVKLQ